MSELTAKDADVPLNETDVAPLKPLPLIATDVPGEPLVGANPLIVGATAGASQEPNLNEPMRVCQLSWDSVAGWFA